MVSYILIIRLMVRPHRQTDILNRPAWISMVTMLWMGELCGIMGSAGLIARAYRAIYGPGLLSDHFPDASAAWTAFQTQAWDLVGLATGMIIIAGMMPGTLAIGAGRKA